MTVGTLGKQALPLFPTRAYLQRWDGLPDPVDYAAALGPKGLAKYQAELNKIAVALPPEMREAEIQAARKLYPGLP